MSLPTLLPETTDSGTGNGRWMVVIFNNDTNSVDEVIDVLMRATGCDSEEAIIETWEAHHYGKAPVHCANQSDCHEIASVISNIGVKTEVAPEWAE